MQCPKCKNEVQNNALKCPNCGAKIATVCKTCGAINPINSIECSNCSNKLLKFCTECGAANLPDSLSCRKCGASFEQTKKVQQTHISYVEINAESQQKVKAKLVEAIKSGITRIITVSGDSGTGKNIVIRCAIEELKNTKLIWMTGSCTHVSQVSPFGYFQDVLLTFFNINNFCPNTMQLKKNSIRFFKQDFPELTNENILDLLNILYPENVDKYENIYFNKAKTFSIVKKVLNAIIQKTKIVFIIDKFEYIDGMSYDFLKELIKDEAFMERVKFVVSTNQMNPGIGILNSPLLSSENYMDLAIAPYSNQQTEAYLSQNSINDKDVILLSDNISGGNPAIIDQIILLYKNIAEKSVKLNGIKSFSDVISLRLKLLKQTDWNAFRMLIAMSVLGYKFYPAMLDTFDNISISEYQRIITKLTDDGYISPLNSLAYEFKSELIWSEIAKITKNEDSFEEILNSLYENLSVYKHSSIALLAYTVQKLNNNDNAFQLWTLLMKHAAYIGDIGLYIIAQKQCLKLIENKNSAFYTKIKKNIYIRVGKLLEPLDCKSSIEYIKNAIIHINDNEDALYIELLGYLTSCLMQEHNYNGAIECTERVLNKIPKEYITEILLVKTKLVRPLLKLGNYGQLTLLVETELLAPIEKLLSKERNLNCISINNLFNLWINLYLDYAEALVFQGDSKAAEIIQAIYAILDKNKISEPSFICRAMLLHALYNSIKGSYKESNKILEDIIAEYQLESIDTVLASFWNFIDLLNRFFLKDYDGYNKEIFDAVTFANNVNDNFTKNILKTLFADVLMECNQPKKALEILDTQVAYFAGEKIATGVLLSWYLIAKIRLATKGTQFALDIAVKALDIAQGVNVNNYYFVTLFNILIGEIYIAKQDFDSAKVYIEKALVMSKRFELQMLIIKTYLLSAKMYQELALPKTGMRVQYIKQALKFYQLAKSVPVFSTEPVLQKKLKQEIAVLTSFCKLNGIIIKKDSD